VTLTLPIRLLLLSAIIIHKPSLALAVQPVKNDNQELSQSKMPLLPDIDGKTRLLEALTQLDPRIDSLLKRTTSALKHRIEKGPPFLIEERSGRIDRLEKLLNDPNVVLAEKYRRVMEAYRVELEYAKTVDAYRAVLKTGKEERLVDFLSIGRLSLYYQTLDGLESGIWRNDRRDWQQHSGEDNESITQGLRIARKLDPPQLIVLPLPGPKSP
jgi:hypothetical protein